MMDIDDFIARRITEKRLFKESMRQPWTATDHLHADLDALKLYAEVQSWGGLTGSRLDREAGALVYTFLRGPYYDGVARPLPEGVTLEHAATFAADTRLWIAGGGEEGERRRREVEMKWERERKRRKERDRRQPPDTTCVTASIPMTTGYRGPLS
jgi:hypothetical protein